jgi:hypothetical protein
LDISKITSISLDLAGSSTSYGSQDKISEFVLFLLAKDYQIFLFSSNQKEKLDKETFQHPRLTFLRQRLPPAEPAPPEHPQLESPHNYWVTDDPKLQAWLVDKGLDFAYLSAGSSFAGPGLKIGSLADLAGMFDTTARLRSSLAQAVVAAHQPKGKRPFLLGVGGPHMSGYQQFAVDLKRELENMGCPLVELLDLSPLLSGGGGDEGDDDGALPWRDPAVGAWLMETVLGPLKAGQRVFVETLPPEIPESFQAHLPLFLSEESIIVILAERLFSREILSLLDYSILLEVSPRETARRLYEIPEAEEFDEKFEAQYLGKEGRVYKNYLQAHSVSANVLVRINAERSGSLSLNHPAEL